tara:strand:- start:1129 stop:1236 length:108 start_codon:yes stop_codon:yes gene_type:complete
MIKELIGFILKDATFSISMSVSILESCGRSYKNER